MLMPPVFQSGAGSRQLICPNVKMIDCDRFLCAMQAAKQQVAGGSLRGGWVGQGQVVLRPPLRCCTP
jgi:hypothetical protein